jgi:uncharacterized membrane protein YqjE
MWLLIWNVFMGVVIGFSLGYIWCLFKLRKSQHKTRILLKELDVLFETKIKPENDKEKLLNEIEHIRKLERLGGRIDVVSEFFGD